MILLKQSNSERMSKTKAFFAVKQSLKKGFFEGKKPPENGGPSPPTPLPKERGDAEIAFCPLPVIASAAKQSPAGGACRAVIRDISDTGDTRFFC
jgi:hypothetical protein